MKGRLLALAAVLLLAAGCGGGEPAAGPGAPVVLRLKWLFNASFAGEIWADQAGLFRAEGLRVVLREGGPEQDAIRDLELGRAQFGIASADQVIRAAAKGADVVVLAQVFQRNPLQWIYRADRIPALTPAALGRLRIGVTYGGNDEAILRALLRKYHVQKAESDLWPVTPDFGPFWRGRVDLWPVYRNTQGVFLADRIAAGGGRPGFLDPAAWGIRFVANSLVTSRAYYRAHPDRVRRFTRAFLRGWREAMDPAREAAVAEAVHRRDTQTPVAVIRRQLAETRRLVLPPGGRPVGAVDLEGWRQTEAILYRQGLVTRRVDVGGLLAGPLP
ncbi:ABC transporter substrate-binding protein [Dissulfurirhabdus thermomarina]|uniref:Thiamine pyrimidine synthase n=1 Tax=Dissulfurirhabdus thermomarina TaxID=1765737 RepID=A0A6N9TL55_DISTH|nr:ABC transporter substrate-binding protein [Dissulfurirhabdus thermomarina]NDY41965.1 ABC transporter substrate-binding protein [Dissulfurirhabdus thermomarina]NMX22812.1 ABC transporter substrate-binding protein [Dissulfurirhabdus thermomarina]